MNGLFAKGSMTEMRGRQGVCSGSCSTYSCIKGSGPTGAEGLATDGCPMAFHSAKLRDNSTCIMCGVCVKVRPCPGSWTHDLSATPALRKGAVVAGSIVLVHV